MNSGFISLTTTSAHPTGEKESRTQIYKFCQQVALCRRRGTGGLYRPVDMAYRTGLTSKGHSHSTTSLLLEGTHSKYLLRCRFLEQEHISHTRRACRHDEDHIND